MQIFNFKQRSIAYSVAAALLLATVACQSPLLQSKEPTAPAAMRDVPAVRLNYRYEADVPAPTLDAAAQTTEERNPAVQADFDANRTQELLDRTLTSPD